MDHKKWEGYIDISKELFIQKLQQESYQQALEYVEEMNVTSPNTFKIFMHPDFITYTDINTFLQKWVSIWDQIDSFYYNPLYVLLS